MKFACQCQHIVSNCFLPLQSPFACFWQAVLETLALALQAALLLEIRAGAFCLVDGVGMIRTLVDGYVAHTAASTASRLWAVIAISSLMDALDATIDDHQHEASPLQQVDTAMHCADISI